MNLVELKDISRSYGKKWALRNVTLNIAEGDKLLLTGPNGAGKTTLLQLLATTLSPTSGTLRLFGQDAEHDLASTRKKLGVLFMESFLYNELSVVENLLFFAQLYDLKEPKNVVDSWLETVQMTRFANARVSTLSRGEKQRVSLARSLLHEPSLLLWDEPTTGLDEEARNFLKVIMDSRPKATLVCVTHDPDFFSSWMNRSVRLVQGSVQT